MQNNEHFKQVGLKLAFTKQTLKQQTSLKKKSVHLSVSDDGLNFVKMGEVVGRNKT